MITNVLERYYPLQWNGANKNEKYQKHYEEIDIDNADYWAWIQNRVMGEFCKKIKRITRVESPYLYGCFLLKQAEYKCKNIPFTVMQLYHDTGEKKIVSILKTNLDWRLPRRVKYGQGVSFSPLAEYANKKSSYSNGTHRVVIVADVLVGHYHTGSNITVLPDEEFDTTIDNCYKNVYVKFYDNEFYPKCLIYYKTK